MTEKNECAQHNSQLSDYELQGPFSGSGSEHKISLMNIAFVFDR